MIPNNVYLASRYSRKEEMRGYAEELGSFGVNVTSSWLKEPHDPGMALKELTPDEHEQLAKDDLQDIIASDVLVFFSEDQNKQPPRGGRHVEFGFAIAMGLKIYVIGERENIFHYLPDVEVFPSWSEFIGAKF